MERHRHWLLSASDPIRHPAYCEEPLYYAVRAAAAVALDRADLDTARSLLADLDRHAAALDTAGGTTTYTAEAAERRRRLAELENAPRRGS